MACSQEISPYRPITEPPPLLEGYRLVWNDEFEREGKPDSSIWSNEHGFQRNNEFQYYRPENANIKDGILVIEGKRERR